MQASTAIAVFLCFTQQVFAEEFAPIFAREIEAHIGDQLIEADIIGGVQQNINESRYLVHVQTSQDQTNFNQYHCGGVILSPDLVCSAAHCFDETIVPAFEYVRIVAGTNTLHPDFPLPGTQHRILHKSEIITSPKYQVFTDGYDFACMVVNPPLGFTDNIGMIGLPIKESATLTLPPVYYDFDGSDVGNCQVLGWGIHNENNLNSYSWRPRMGVPVVLDDTQCHQQFQCIKDRIICISQTNPRNCFADSGGPMVCTKDGKLVLAGISSFGATNCDSSSSHPSVYVAVSAHHNFLATLLDSSYFGLPDPDDIPSLFA